MEKAKKSILEWKPKPKERTRNNLERVVLGMNEKIKNELKDEFDESNGKIKWIVLAASGIELNEFDTDTSRFFRHEANFEFIFSELPPPGCFGLILADTDGFFKTVLLVPRFSLNEKVYNGRLDVCNVESDLASTVDSVDYLKNAKSVINDFFGELVEVLC